MYRHIRLAQAIGLKLVRLAAEAALDKGDNHVEAAVAGEILVPGLGREPALLRLGKSHSHASDCFGSRLCGNGRRLRCYPIPPWANLA
jgi:hypothetical protein